MPTRIYAPNKNNPSTSNWQTPSSISIYNDGWKTVKVAYNYDMGVWKVVYPDPIIPSITFTDTSAGKDPNDGLLYIGASVQVTNGSGQIFAELFLGSTPSGTPITSQNFSAFYVNGNDRYYEPYFYSASFTNNQNYCIRVTATSITENQSVLSSGAIYLGIPSVYITSYSVPSTGSFSVSWSSQNQYRWRVSILNQLGGAMHQSNNGNWTISSSTTYSSTISPPLLGNTQYTILVEIENTNFDGASASQPFTSPNDPIPIIQITDGSLVQTCSTLGVSWTAQNTSYGYAKIYLATFPDGIPTYTEITNKRLYWTTQRTHTFTGLSSGENYLLEIIGYNVNDVAGPVDNELTSTNYPSAPAPPSNFTAISSEYGSRVDLYWTAPPTGSCITANEGYSIQYKLSSSNEWITLSNTIANTSTTYSTTAGGVTTTANTAYDFRIWTRSSPTNSTYAYASVTTNNTPYSVYVYTLPLATTTFSTVTVYAQLRNISNANVALSGRTVTFSATAGRGTFSATTANTNANGLASVTYTTNATTGNIDFFGQSAGVPVTGSYSLSVSLSPGLTPSLSVARTNFGYDITHSNYNSSYSYSGSVGGGGFLSGGNWNTNFYTIIIPPINTAEPSASYTSTQVTCTSGSWNANPSSTTTVTSSRTGYNNASASVTNSPTGSITTYDYVWYFDDGTVWGSGQTRNIGALVKGRTIRCLVTVTRTGGNQNWAWSKFITVPA